jgi:hypothetical protein
MPDGHPVLMVPKEFRKLQEVKNNAFNNMLDCISYRKVNWECLPEKYNLWQIKKRSSSLLDIKQ